MGFSISHRGQTRCCTYATGSPDSVADTCCLPQCNSERHALTSLLLLIRNRPLSEKGLLGPWPDMSLREAIKALLEC